jgi:hypothetical protein
MWMVCRLPWRWRLAMTSVALLVWWPLALGQYRQVPHRTVADLERCAQLVCVRYKDRMYVSTQAWNDFHSGYEYSFFFNKYGCFTRDIGQNPRFSQTMAVVVDRGFFDPATTDFFELSQFGPRQLQEKIVCQPELEVYFFTHKGN